MTTMMTTTHQQEKHEHQQLPKQTVFVATIFIRAAEFYLPDLISPKTPFPTTENAAASPTSRSYTGSRIARRSSGEGDGLRAGRLPREFCYVRSPAGSLGQRPTLARRMDVQWCRSMRRESSIEKSTMSFFLLSQLNLSFVSSTNSSSARLLPSPWSL